jgi:hypothetical protein
VLPKYGRPWFLVPHRKLNFILILCGFLSSTNSGFDGSILNGFQSMQNWEDYFDEPTGASLGELANGYTFGAFIAMPVAPYF